MISMSTSRSASTSSVLPVFDDLLSFDGALVIRQDVLASHADLEALA